MEMKYKIGEEVMILSNRKTSKIVAIDSEAGWYRLENSPLHYSEEKIALFPFEVFYVLIIHYSIHSETKHYAVLFKDIYIASNYMQDLFERSDDLRFNRCTTEYNDGESFYIYNDENPLEYYSCEIKAVKTY